MTTGGQSPAAAPPQPSYRRLEGDRRVIGDVTRRAALTTLSLALVVTAGVSTYVAARDVPGDDDGEHIGRMTTTSCVYDTRSDPGRDHVDAPAYAVLPPAGGPHLATPAAPGISGSGSAPALGTVVHALEHGLVALWVDSSDSAARAELEAVAREFPDDVLLVPLAGVPRGGAATAWHRRLLCAGVDAGAVRLFVATFRGRGPERVRSRNGG